MKNNFEQFMSFFNDNSNNPANIADYLLKNGNRSDIDQFKTTLLIIEQSLFLAQYKFSFDENNSTESALFCKLIRESAERLNDHVKRICEVECPTKIQPKKDNSLLNGISLN